MNTNIYTTKARQEGSQLEELCEAFLRLAKSVGTGKRKDEALAAIPNQTGNFRNSQDSEGLQELQRNQLEQSNAISIPTYVFL